MTWTILRIIWLREVRDLLRDRRTLLMIVVLPAVLYPVMGAVGVLLALGTEEQPSAVGICGIAYLPGTSSARVPAATAWLTWTPALEAGWPRLIGAIALAENAGAARDYPPLVVDGRFPDALCHSKRESQVMRVEAMPDADLEPLQTRRIDVLLVIPPDLRQQLDAGRRPTVELYSRRGDERARLAERRVRALFGRWKKSVQEVRLAHRGLPADFDDPIALLAPDRDGAPLKRTSEELSEWVARFFPFMLIMWSMAGALYPAIDVCAGEKERGTLETLLLSPASRAEIVGGKFLAVWVFSAASALWNLVWMGGGAWLSHAWLPFPILRPVGLLWCAVLAVLLSALFSAVSLALGAYAKSTKEGQYYLLPLVLVTMPLTFLPLLPDVELNFWYGLVPITGATLLLQRLMLGVPGPEPWFSFVPVLLSLALSIALALRWAVSQFHREDVLFREAERLGWSAMIRAVRKR